MQTAIVCAVMIAAASYLVIRARRSLKGKGGCGCGCGCGCTSKSNSGCGRSCEGR